MKKTIEEIKKEIALKEKEIAKLKKEIAELKTKTKKYDFRVVSHRIDRETKEDTISTHNHLCGDSQLKEIVRVLKYRARKSTYYERWYELVDNRTNEIMMEIHSQD